MAASLSVIALVFGTSSPAMAEESKTLEFDIPVSEYTVPDPPCFEADYAPTWSPELTSLTWEPYDDLYDLLDVYSVDLDWTDGEDTVVDFRVDLDWENGQDEDCDSVNQDGFIDVVLAVDDPLLANSADCWDKGTDPDFARCQAYGVEDLVGSIIVPGDTQTGSYKATLTVTWTPES